MANLDNPHGFTLYRSGQSEPTRRVRPAPANRSPSAAIFIGDAYTLVSGNATAATATPSVINGIVEAIELNPIPAYPQGPTSQDYIVAAEAGAIIGIEDNSAEFNVQCAGIYTDALGGSYTDLSAVTGNVPLRRSGMTVILPDGTATRELRVAGRILAFGNNAGETNTDIIVHTTHAV